MYNICRTNNTNNSYYKADTHIKSQVVSDSTMYGGQSFCNHEDIISNKRLLLRGASYYLCLEVNRGSKLYTLADELIRWRGLLDNRFVQFKLDKRHKKELYSQ